MSEFVYLFRGSPAAARAGSPQEMQQQLQQWMTWAKELTDKGHLKSTGLRLGTAGKVVKQGAVSDGPFTEAKDIVGGFMIIEAESLEHAVTLSSGCPVLERGGSVEVRPVVGL